MAEHVHGGKVLLFGGVVVAVAYGLHKAGGIDGVLADIHGGITGQPATPPPTAQAPAPGITVFQPSSGVSQWALSNNMQASTVQAFTNAIGRLPASVNELCNWTQANGLGNPCAQQVTTTTAPTGGCASGTPVGSPSGATLIGPGNGIYQYPDGSYVVHNNSANQWQRFPASCTPAQLAAVAPGY